MISERKPPRCIARLVGVPSLTLLTLLALNVPSCAQDSVGLEVPVAYRGEPPAPGSLATADATAVNLSSARVALNDLELRACPATTLGALSALTHTLALALGPTRARAHTVGSPTRIGVPAVVDGLRVDALHPGMFRPTPGTYCGVRGTLASPDSDALNVPGGEPLTGAVELHGERLDAGGGVVSSFRLLSTLSVSFERTFAEPLVLDAAQPYADLVVVLDTVAWVNAVTLPAGRLSVEEAGALSTAAAAALRVELTRSAP